MSVQGALFCFCLYDYAKKHLQPICSINLNLLETLVVDNTFSLRETFKKWER